MVEERLHVDDQVLDHRQAEDRLDRQGVALDRPDQRLARQRVDVIDPHGVRAADPVGARPAQAQRLVLVPLDRQQDVEDPVHRVGGSLELLPARLGVVLGVVASDPDRQVPRRVIDLRDIHVEICFLV